MRAQILFLVLIITTVGACSSKPKVAVPPGLNAGSSSPGEPKVVTPTLPPLTITEATKSTPALIARPVTSLGDNREPKFSPDGGKLLYLSSDRSSHRQTQVYELDLLRSTERRVTFHDGDDEGVSWANATWFTYSSNTDESKEGAQALERLKNLASSKVTASSSSLAGTEIYLQRLDGREIHRMTDSPGQDSTPDADPTSNGSRIVFVSTRENGPKLFLLDRKGARKISDGADDHPAFRQDGKALAWERTEADGMKSRIYVSENLKTAMAVTSENFRDRHPAWHPKMDAIVFSSNRGGSHFDLFLFDRKAQCLKRMTQGDFDAFYPSFSPDGSKLAFVVPGPNGLNQIYVMEDRSAALPCM